MFCYFDAISRCLAELSVTQALLCYFLKPVQSQTYKHYIVRVKPNGL